jgi:hypothetical protein
MKHTLYLPLALLALAALACAVPFVGEKPTPTPALRENQAGFTALYTSYLKPNDYLPGANVQYVAENENGYEILIDGAQAVKKLGDSLSWKGISAPGVTLDYQLRILGVFFGQFEATGPLNIIIDDVLPVAGTAPEQADLYFDKLAITTSAKVGENFRGMSIGYAGKTEQGAQLTGVDGYAYREVGDSVDWEGQVRANVWLKASLRVTDITATELKLAGTGEIWINQR